MTSPSSPPSPPPPPLFDGPFTDLSRHPDLAQHAAAVRTALTDQGRDPEKALAGWRARIMQTTTLAVGSGEQVVHCDCEYFAPGSSKPLKSRRAVLKELGIVQKKMEEETILPSTEATATTDGKHHHHHRHHTRKHHHHSSKKDDQEQSSSRKKSRKIAGEDEVPNGRQHDDDDGDTKPTSTTRTKKKSRPSTDLTTTTPATHPITKPSKKSLVSFTDGVTSSQDLPTTKRPKWGGSSTRPKRLVYEDDAPPTSTTRQHGAADDSSLSDTDKPRSSSTSRRESSTYAWIPDEFGELPSLPRQRILRRAQILAERFILRVARVDSRGFFVGEEFGGALRPAHAGSLASVKDKIDKGAFFTVGRFATMDWDALLQEIERVLAYKPVLPLARSTTPTEDLAALAWNLKKPLARNEVTTTTVTTTTTTPEEKMDEFTTISRRILNLTKEYCEERKTKLEQDLEIVKNQETEDWMTSRNVEPSMPQWRKEPLQVYPYTIITEYVPAQGLLPEEATAILDKLLEPGSENQVVYPEGLELVDLWGEVIASDEKCRLNHESLDWNSMPASGVHEQHTWGIDCFTRKNIELALHDVPDETLKMSLSQVHWFVERRLMPAIHAVKPIEMAWDLRLALRNLIDELSSPRQQDDTAMELTTTTTTTTSIFPVGTRVAVFWADDNEWYSGRILDHRHAPHDDDGGDGRNTTSYHILYDADRVNQWETYDPNTFKIVSHGGHVTELHTVAPIAKQVAGCEHILAMYEKWGANSFAVHSKGLGVITDVEIKAAKMVSTYYGELYPSWLWEEKENAEDAARARIRETTSSGVILPDFWNMRLEFPSKTKGGYDVLHVDAKRFGNFASRMSHSCRPNCGAMTAVIDGKFCVAMRALRDIAKGEELTIDYNCVTDSMDEFRAAICLCGAHDCRGSFLYVTQGAAQQNRIVERSHTPLHRVAMLLMACYVPGEMEKAFGGPFTETWPRWIPDNDRKHYRRGGGGGSSSSSSGKGGGRKDGSVIDADEQELESKTLILSTLRTWNIGERASDSLPDWALRYATYAIDFIECERLEHPRLALRYLQEETVRQEKKMTLTQHDLETEWRNYVVDSKGVASQRVTNLVVALDKARHWMCDRLSMATVAQPTFAVVNNNPESTTTTTTRHLRERWWIGDRCWARWVGDDAEEYPDWYAATVTHVYVHSAELRVAYDTGEVNRIPQSMARRPTLQDESYPAPYTAMSVKHHQHPLRTLDEENTAFYLWNDVKFSVAARVVELLSSICSRDIPLWQVATSTAPSTRGRVYWWNFNTREVRLEAPSKTETQLVTTFSPTIISKMREFLKKHRPTNRVKAQECLLELRDMILRVPSVAAGSNRLMEDQHQKAADILTTLAYTRNFFVMSEPEVEEDNVENHRSTATSTTTRKSSSMTTRRGMKHKVIPSLMSWIGGETKLLDITEMVGSVTVPHIETAYDASSPTGWSAMRPSLIRHYASDKTRLLPWSSQLVSFFPKAQEMPPQPSDAEHEWPHPIPPLRLCGSPALDVAIYELIDYSRACASVREAICKQYGGGGGSNEDVDSFTAKNKTVEEAAMKERAKIEIINPFVDALRKSVRGQGHGIVTADETEAKDMARVLPPPLQAEEVIQYTWVECEDCKKWRRLPLKIKASDLPDPFVCRHLGPDIDPLHASCAVPQQSEYELEPVLPRFKGDFMQNLKQGDFLDAFKVNDGQWGVAEVYDTDMHAVRIVFLVKDDDDDGSSGSEGGGDDDDQLGEWHSKIVAEGAFPSVAPLHTFTSSEDTWTRRAPYGSVKVDAAIRRTMGYMVETIVADGQPVPYVHDTAPYPQSNMPIGVRKVVGDLVDLVVKDAKRGKRGTLLGNGVVPSEENDGIMDDDDDHMEIIDKADADDEDAFKRVKRSRSGGGKVGGGGGKKRLSTIPTAVVVGVRNGGGSGGGGGGEDPDPTTTAHPLRHHEFANMSATEKNAFVDYFEAERVSNPLTPFLFAWARWRCMDEGLRHKWEKLRQVNPAFAAPPNRATFPQLPLDLEGRVVPFDGVLVQTPRQISVRAFLLPGMPVVSSLFGHGVVLSRKDTSSVVIDFGWGRVYAPHDTTRGRIDLHVAAPPDKGGVHINGAIAAKRRKMMTGKDQFQPIMFAVDPSLAYVEPQVVSAVMQPIVAELEALHAKGDEEEEKSGKATRRGTQDVIAPSHEILEEKCYVLHGPPGWDQEQFVGLHSFVNDRKRTWRFSRWPHVGS